MDRHKALGERGGWQPEGEATHHLRRQLVNAMAESAERGMRAADDAILKEIKEREIEKGRGDQVVHEGCFDDIRPASAAVDEGREVAWKEMHVDWPIVTSAIRFVKAVYVEEQPLAVDRGYSRLPSPAPSSVARRGRR